MLVKGAEVAKKKRRSRFSKLRKEQERRGGWVVGGVEGRKKQLLRMKKASRKWTGRLAKDQAKRRVRAERARKVRRLWLAKRREEEFRAVALAFPGLSAAEIHKGLDVLGLRLRGQLFNGGQRQMLILRSHFRNTVSISPHSLTLLFGRNSHAALLLATCSLLKYYKLQRRGSPRQVAVVRTLKHRCPCLSFHPFTPCSVTIYTILLEWLKRSTSSIIVCQCTCHFLLIKALSLAS